MSAFVCHAATIKALAIFAASGNPPYGAHVNPSYLRKCAPGVHALSGEELATEYARILLAENIRSVEYLYSDANDMIGDRDIAVSCEEYHGGRYRFAPVQILKLCDCLDYQSCEPNDWQDSAAFELLERIRHAAIRTLPGYDDAEWGIDDRHIRPASSDMVSLSSLIVAKPRRSKRR